MNLSLTEEKSSPRGPRRSEKKSSSPDSLRVLIRGAVAAESRALAFAFVALVVGIVVGAFVFAGEPAALSGARSVGVTAAFLAGVSAGVAFATNYLRLVRSTRPRPLSIGVRWRIG
ncbi:hypothetical protein, partial [Brachybacterium sp. AOP29-B2-41]|uniref:hypothetical protein n=1 Tax=Brachybacterium sp. AOP29-B2-41 TaxID=3457704 RepID=UPI0040335237